jgi:hypothetical protein
MGSASLQTLEDVAGTGALQFERADDDIGVRQRDCQRHAIAPDVAVVARAEGREDFTFANRTAMSRRVSANGRETAVGVRAKSFLDRAGCAVIFQLRADSDHVHPDMCASPNSKSDDRRGMGETGCAGEADRDHEQNNGGSQGTSPAGEQRGAWYREC